MLMLFCPIIFGADSLLASTARRCCAAAVLQQPIGCCELTSGWGCCSEALQSELILDNANIWSLWCAACISYLVAVIMQINASANVFIFYRYMYVLGCQIVTCVLAGQHAYLFI